MDHGSIAPIDPIDDHSDAAGDGDDDGHVRGSPAPQIA